MKNCRKCGELVTHTCRVCVLIDKDTSQKPTRYCDTCGHYICDNCERNTAKRAAAMLIDQAVKAKAALKKIFS